MLFNSGYYEKDRIDIEKKRGNVEVKSKNVEFLGYHIPDLRNIVRNWHIIFFKIMCVKTFAIRGLYSYLSLGQHFRKWNPLATPNVFAICLLAFINYARVFGLLLLAITSIKCMTPKTSYSTPGEFSRQKLCSQLIDGVSDEPRTTLKNNKTHAPSQPLHSRQLLIKRE